MRAEPVSTRPNAASTAMVATLKSLKLFGMAHAVAELAAQGAPAFDAAQSMLGQLLKAETAEREVRSVGYQMKVARSSSTASRSTCATSRACSCRRRRAATARPART